MRSLLALACLLLSVELSHARTEGDTSRRRSPSGSWFFATAGYRCPLNQQKVINSGHGLCFELGFNAGRLISKRTFIGLFVGWSQMDRFWTTSFNSSFARDYASSLNTEQDLSPNYAAIINTSSELFASKSGRAITLPGCEMNSFHNYTLYYGLVLKPFRQKSTAIKIYAGSLRSHYQGAGKLVTAGDYNIFQLRRPITGFEFLFHPDLFGEKWCSALRTLALSVFYEYSFLDHASLYFDDGNKQENIPLSRFTNEGFRKKYKHEQIAGVKISFSLF